MTHAFICEAYRTPIGRFGGALAGVRADDLAAVPLAALLARFPALAGAVDDVIMGCANQAGEDNRNVARMAALLAGLGEDVPGTTLNRLCGSGMDAIAYAARSIMAGEGELYIAGGVESMSRAPFVMPKAEVAYSRANAVYDTTIGWRFVNKRMDAQFGTAPIPETAENVADDFAISREDQDRFAVLSQEKAGRAMASGRFAAEIAPVTIPRRRGDPVVVDSDEHPRPDTTLADLARLAPIVRPGGTVTAGNASGVNDGAAAVIVATQAAAEKYGLRPRAKVLGAAVAGVALRIMGIGPVPASRNLMDRLGLTISDFEVIELNEAFAAQGLAVMRQLGLADDAPEVNPNGGAIALGHPLGMSGARLVQTATEELDRSGARRAARLVHDVHRGGAGDRAGARAGVAAERRPGRTLRWRTGRARVMHRAWLSPRRAFPTGFTPA